MISGFRSMVTYSQSQKGSIRAMSGISQLNLIVDLGSEECQTFAIKIHEAYEFIFT